MWKRSLLRVIIIYHSNFKKATDGIGGVPPEGASNHLRGCIANLGVLINAE